MKPKESAGPLDRTRTWIEDIVVGLGLCPFAAPALGRARWALAPEAELPALLQRFAAEVQHMEEHPEVSTTLLVVPAAPADFAEFHGWTGACEDWLAEAELAGVFQVVSFHPRFRFADSRPGDLSVYVNRSPVPMWHLLREDEVAAAIAGCPGGIASVGRRNQQLLRGLGPAALRSRLAPYLPPDALP